MVIWIIGLPGSGKTTLAKELHTQLNINNKAVHIDGDDMRNIWGEDIGYKIEDRKKNSKRIQKLSKLFEKQGLIVIVSIMSIFKEHRIENKEIYQKYFEVYLDININILKQRRKIYQEAIDKKRNNVVGVDINYDKPTTYDILFKDNKTVDFMGNEIMNRLGY
jgi:adenylylsulfate kinase